jgi:hypothetical protein
VPETHRNRRFAWPKQPTLVSLERAIFRALQTAGRDLSVQAFGLLEQTVIAGARQRRRRRRRRRYLIARFGE